MMGVGISTGGRGSELVSPDSSRCFVRDHPLRNPIATESMCKVSILVHPLHSPFDVSCYSMEQIPLIHRAYSPFTLLGPFESPSGRLPSVHECPHSHPVRYHNARIVATQASCSQWFPSRTGFEPNLFTRRPPSHAAYERARIETINASSEHSHPCAGKVRSGQTGNEELGLEHRFYL